MNENGDPCTTLFFNNCIDPVPVLDIAFTWVNFIGELNPPPKLIDPVGYTPKKVNELSIGVEVYDDVNEYTDPW